MGATCLNEEELEEFVVSGIILGLFIYRFRKPIKAFIDNGGLINKNKG